jgi:hypothetical protein
MFFSFRADSQARKAIVAAGAGLVVTHGVMIPCRPRIGSTAAGSRRSA